VSSQEPDERRTATVLFAVTLLLVILQILRAGREPASSDREVVR